MKFFLVILFIFKQFNLYSNELTDIIGNQSFYKTKYDETLIEIARSNNLAFPEIMSANDDLNDPWVVSQRNICFYLINIYYPT